MHNNDKEQIKKKLFEKIYNNRDIYKKKTRFYLFLFIKFKPL